MDHPTPLVRIVVVNFDGGQLTMDCLQSLRKTDWPADRLEIVLVDNGSGDDVVERVRIESPEVRVIEPLVNTGFAGGCNLGIQAPGDHDFVALVNNDAVVDPGWLRPLANVLLGDPRLGAACPKILLAGRYLEVSLAVPDAARVGRDPRTLGVRLTDVRLDGRRADNRLSFDEGWFLPQDWDGEEAARWSWRRSRLRVRVEEDEPLPVRLSLQVAAACPRTVEIASGPWRHVVPVDAPVWIHVPLSTDPIDIINNAGSALYRGGFGGDRGFLEPDDGRYDDPVEVFAWCGGAVLLRRRYLDDVGLFDERLFLYYEDMDLSWRGRLRGWRYRYVPESVVRHRHAGTSVMGSPLFRYYNERNRPLVLAKNAPAGLAWRAGAGLARRTLASTVRNPRSEVAHEWRVLAGYLHLLPGRLRHRWRAGRKASRRALMSWEQTKDVSS